MFEPIAPCPFCSSLHLHVSNQCMAFQVNCETCLSTGPSRKIFDQAIAEWNALSHRVAWLRENPPAIKQAGL